MTIIKLFHVQFHLINFQYFAPDMPNYALSSHCDYHRVLFSNFDVQQFRFFSLLFKFIKCKHFIDFVCYSLLQLLSGSFIAWRKIRFSISKWKLNGFVCTVLYECSKKRISIQREKNWTKISLRVWKLGRQEELVEKKLRDSTVFNVHCIVTITEITSRSHSRSCTTRMHS